MIRILFDTDGVRGNANREPITPETVRDGGRKQLVVIGKGTRS